MSYPTQNMQPGYFINDYIDAYKADEREIRAIQVVNYPHINTVSLYPNIERCECEYDTAIFRVYWDAEHPGRKEERRKVWGKM